MKLDLFPGACAPRLGPAGPLARTRLLEALGYISSEIHEAFEPLLRPGASEAEKAEAARTIGKRLAYFADRMTTDYLFGGQVSVADCYLYVMLTWAKKNAIPLPPPLPAVFARMAARPAVRRALDEEGLEQQAA